MLSTTHVLIHSKQKRANNEATEKNCGFTDMENLSPADTPSGCGRGFCNFLSTDNNVMTANLCK